MTMHHAFNSLMCAIEQMPGRRFTLRELVAKAQELIPSWTRKGIAQCLHANFKHTGLVRVAQGVYEKMNLIQNCPDVEEDWLAVFLRRFFRLSNERKVELVSALLPGMDQVDLLVQYKHFYPEQTFRKVNVGDVLFHSIYGRVTVQRLDPDFLILSVGEEQDATGTDYCGNDKGVRVLYRDFTEYANTVNGGIQ